MRRAAILVVLVLGLHAPCSLADQALTSRQESHLGTWVSITVAEPESAEVEAAIEAGFAEVARLESLLSEWRQDSQIAELNRAAGRSAVQVGPELFELAQMAREVSAATDGAFDVSAAGLSGLWDFKATQPRKPKAEDIARRLELVGWRGLLLDEKTLGLRLDKAGMRCGFGAIAKGYIVDRVSAVLKTKGLMNHLVIAGGDLYASGRKGEQRWRIGIQHPAGRKLYASIEVENEGMATSGNYEKFFILDGQRYHHILDPRTGWPTRGVSSTTVLAKTAAEADAYATGLFVMGVDKGAQLAESRADLDALFFREDFSTTATSGIERRMQRL